MDLPNSSPSSKFQHFLEILWSDFWASLVVFLVALPLSMGIAIASGLDPIYGIWAAIIGGMAAGIHSGVSLQINGPAAGLVVITGHLLASHGLAGMGLVVFVAGLLQILAAQFKLGQVLRFISKACLDGMLAGIGLLIILSQILVLLGHAPSLKGLSNAIAIPEALLSITPLTVSNPHLFSLLIGVMTVLLYLAWERMPSSCPVSKVPSPLIAVCGATVLSNLAGFPVDYIELPADILSVLSWPNWSSWAEQLLSWKLAFSSLELLFVSSVETLLVSLVIIRMAPEQSRKDLNQALSSIGLTNTLSGLLGMMPMSGIIVRSSVNVRSGAKSQLSSLFLGLWLLLFLIFLPQWLHYLPVSSLAAILILAGIKLFHLDELVEMFKSSPWNLSIWGITFLGVIFKDLLVGVSLGLLVSGLRWLWSRRSSS